MLKGIAAISKALEANPGQESKKTDINASTFGEILQGLLAQVNQAQLEAQASQQRLVLGDDIELHTVMIQAERANLALQFTLAIRNKLFDAYHEIMRMQI